jgi:outer membrane protein assembly factor BamD
MRIRKHTALPLVALALIAGLSVTGCGRKSKAQAPDLSGSAEPDKVLFESAQRDIERNRHTIARLTLQTLINTYPDSEYLAKAMLAIADSYFDEGGTAGLTQAVASYKDFITFFPYLDEAAEAQYKAAMCHYRRMEKPDRDRTQALKAEEEFQIFLKKHAEHSLAGEAAQRLREVQEVLAEGDYRIGRFYYLKDTPNAYKASAFRLAEIVDRYPLYSQADKALWMLGQGLEKLEQPQMAGKYYSRLVSEYPLSDLVAGAKQRLEHLGVPIPQPNPEALARMQKEREYERERPGMLRRSMGILRSGPDVSSAARTGQPNLEPPPDGFAESLKPSGDFSVQGGAAGGSGTGATGSPGVEVVPPGKASSAANTNAGSQPAETKKDEEKKDPKKDDKKKDEKKKQDAKKKPDESSSKKKKGFRKLFPW